MTVPYALLGLLEREPSHGYDLKRDYDTYFGRGKPLPFGQVYATLARLARDGKVIAGEAEPGAGPDRKRYVIDEQGATDLETWRAARLQRMRELTEVRRVGGVVDSLLADHGLFHLEADLRWIDLTVARLSALAREVRP